VQSCLWKQHLKKQKIVLQNNEEVLSAWDGKGPIEPATHEEEEKKQGIIQCATFCIQINDK
jgi:hypothetical protein